MKKLILYTVSALAVFALSSCQNKDLVDPPTSGNVRVSINWEEGLNVPTKDGMRLNMFSLDPDGAHYGRAEVAHDGAEVNLGHGTTHKTLVYNYTGNNVRFRNENHPDLIEATSGAMVRATYTRAFPDENTISEVVGDMHVDMHPSFTVEATDEAQVIEVWPQDIVTTFTYEVRNIVGASFIRQTRGAIAGFSASHFMATGELSPQPSTILFNGTVNVADGTITGSFRTFGRLADSVNDFTIEILFPSNNPGNGIIQKTWDVSAQIAGGATHIIIDDSGIEIPDEGGGETGAGGWEVDLTDWNDVTVNLN